MSKFYIGQKIVAIRDHSQGYFKKGNEFQVLDVKQGCCFGLLKIDSDPFLGFSRCRCGNKHRLGYTYYNENCFAPLQEIGDFTFEDAIALSVEQDKFVELQTKN